MEAANAAQHESDAYQQGGELGGRASRPVRASRHGGARGSAGASPSQSIGARLLVEGLLLIALLTASCGRGASPTPPATVTGTREEAQAAASVASPTATLTPGATATPAATPVPCLDDSVAPPSAPTPTSALRIAYWSQGKLWDWAEESELAVPFPLPEGIAAARISADGQWIAYQRVLDERRSELWAVRADGTDPRLLATVDTAEVYARNPELTNGELRFDWLEGTHTLEFYVLPFAEGRGWPGYDAVFLADADTGQVRQVVSPGEVSILSYAPDAGQLAAVAEDELRLIGTTDGRVQYRYAADGARFMRFGPRYSPDGRYLAMLTEAGVMVVETASGARRDIAFAYKRIVTPGGAFLPSVLCLTGSPVFYTLIPEGETYDALWGPGARFTVWRVDIEEGTARPLYPLAGSVSSAQISPDGRRLAFMAEEADYSQHLCLLDLESGRQVLYASSPRSPILNLVGWHPDSTRFVYGLYRDWSAEHQLGHICGEPQPLANLVSLDQIIWIDAVRFAVLSERLSEEPKLALHTLAGEVTSVATLTDPPYYRFRFAPATLEEPPTGSGG